jgi:hypothetical protein
VSTGTSKQLQSQIGKEVMGIFSLAFDANLSSDMQTGRKVGST